MEPAQSHTILLPWIAKKYGIKTLALTSTDDETGLVQAEDAEKEAKKIGLTITDKAFAPRGTADFTPMLTKLIAKNPQAIDFGSWAGSEGPLICKQVKELGYKGLLIFSYVQSISVFQKVAGEYMDGTLFYSIFAADPTPLAARVTKRYQEKYKERIDPIVLRTTTISCWSGKPSETAGTLDTTAVRNLMSKVKAEGCLEKPESAANPITESTASSWPPFRWRCMTGNRKSLLSCTVEPCRPVIEKRGRNGHYWKFQNNRFPRSYNVRKYRAGPSTVLRKVTFPRKPRHLGNYQRWKGPGRIQRSAVVEGDVDQNHQN